MKKLAFIFLLLLSLFLYSCDNISFNKDLNASLADADKAIASFDLIQAEKILDRILNDETDSTIRYEAYLKIIDLSKMLYSDERWAVEYLEAMAVEFKQPPELKYILTNLAKTYERIGDSFNASKYWFRLIDEIELNDVELADIYNHISRSYLLSNQFDLAEDMSLSCIGIAEDYTVKASCSYTLAQIHVLNNKIDDAIVIFEKIYNNPESPAELKLRVALSYADALEVKLRYPEALKIYESIQELYPNPQLIQLRMDNLKQVMKKASIN